ncbi:excalibur calcium-binding domain-containing protein [Mycobacterium hackensackense]|uniref:excalibur calcium-binding domain-containing protein n=1 Tax=Mycobacterium hackensackense TaxID=228909 RepID=UPI0022659B50|nr:excalibur calcium-binding domain-containing protein [Mycobacterium hackensackense]MCV7254163.1 excalibur calcium-binding domain-containing protein [Mycobacterium hackensackense]
MVRALIAATLIAVAGAAVAPAAQAAGPYKNCTEAHKDGRYNIPQGDPDYKDSQVRDGDGVACEG